MVITLGFRHPEFSIVYVANFIISWGLAYNLYGEKMTGLSIFPESVYNTSELHSFIPSKKIHIYCPLLLVTAWYQTHSSTCPVKMR